MGDTFLLSTARHRRFGGSSRSRRRPGGTTGVLLAVIITAAVVAAGFHGLRGSRPTTADGIEHTPRPVAVRFTLCAEGARDNCVVDGDTIWLHGEKIRLADIDTPEIAAPGCASEAARGHEATRRLLALINAGPVTIVRAGTRDSDRYGRKLRIVEVGGRSLGDILVAEGLARRWDGARRNWCA